MQIPPPIMNTNLPPPNLNVPPPQFMQQHGNSPSSQASNQPSQSGGAKPMPLMSLNINPVTGKSILCYFSYYLCVIQYHLNFKSLQNNPVDSNINKTLKTTSKRLNNK